MTLPMGPVAAGRTRSGTTLVAIAVAAGLTLLGAGPARASTFPVTGSFTGPALDSGWSLPASETIGGSGGAAKSNLASLTGTSTVPGWLQLTNTSGNSVGWVYDTSPFPSGAGLNVSFDYADYGGTGADGLTLFLFGQNSNTSGNPLPLTTGPTGGSLGYADCPSSHEDGLTNAYLGVGLDEWGNFGLTNFCGVPTGAGTAGVNPTGRYPSYAIVRGPGSAQTGYAYATGAAVVDPGNAGETLKGSSLSDMRHVSVSLTAAGLLSVYVTFPDGNTETVTRDYQLSSAPPPYLQLGFVASTGGSTDYHDIRRALVTEPVDVQTRVASATATATRGAAISDTFTVRNAGPNETAATQIAASTPATLSGVSWTCSGACNATSGSGLPSDTVDLSAGATATYTITAADNSTNDAAAAITLTATPTGATGQSVPGDDAATASTVLPPVALTAPSFALADGASNYTGAATATAGTYFGAGVTVSEQWQRCAPDGSGCADIAGATGATYATTGADRGSTLRVGEVASNAAGSTPVAYSPAYSPLPVTTLNTATPAVTNQTSASFALGTSNYPAAQVSYECDLDGAGWSGCAAAPTFTGLSDGAHTLQVRSVYAGLSDPSVHSYSWTVDTVAPPAPVIAAPADGADTPIARPVISGTAEAHSAVTVTLDGTPTVTTTADASGAWSYTPPTALADGAHAVTATATDAAGNVSPTSSTTHFTVDTLAPAAPAVVAPANGAAVASARPPVSGTAEAHSTVTVTIDGAAAGTATAGGAGAWTFTPPAALADGPHSVQATATDAAGNVSPSSSTARFTVDTVPPSAPSISAPANASYVSSGRPLVSGTAEAASTVTVYLDGVAAATVTADGSGGWAYTPSGALAEGAHTVAATAADATGNVSPPSSTNHFTVDTVPPPAPTLAAPADGSSVNSVKPALSGTAEAGSAVTVYVDGAVAGTATANASGAWSLTPAVALGEGAHSARADATDAAGNVSPSSATHAFTVDTIAPAAPVVTAPADGTDTNNARPAVSGTAEPGSTVTIYVDGAVAGTAAVSAGGAWSFTGTATLGDGPHTVAATATDAANNASPRSSAARFTVDTVAPAAPVVAVPVNGSATNDVKPPMSGTAEPGSTVLVYVDGAAAGITTTNAAGAWAYTPTVALADGTHTVKATATDAASNVSPFSGADSFAVDTVPPAPPLLSTPAGGALTNDATPAVSGTADAHETVTVYFDGVSSGTTTTDAAGAWTYTPSTALADGAHTVKATATDVAGNMSAFSVPRGFTVDTTPPPAPAVSAPAESSATNDVTPAITGTAVAGATVAVYIDGTPVGTATAGGTGAWSLTLASALGDGAHAVEATATDQAGNTSAFSSANDFTVDTVAPAAPVITAPADATYSNEKEPAITGTAEPHATVRVFIDGVPTGFTTTDATGQWSYVPTAPLADGAHTVTATAIDAAGNASAVSYPTRFTVLTVAPVAPVVSAKTGGLTTSNTEPPITGTAAANSTVTVYVDGTQVGTTTTNGAGAWSYTPSAPLGNGPHTVRVTVTDPADNVSPLSNTLVVTVDTTPPPAPVLTAPANASYTNNNEPPIGGTAQANTTITVYIDGFPAGTAPADGAGNWAYTPSAPLGDGLHTVKATATDAALNVSGYSNSNSFTVDTVAPSAPQVILPANGSTTNNSKPPISGMAEVASTVTVYLDGSAVGTATADGSGVWSYTPSTALVDGQHHVKATATDAAGNTSGASSTDSFWVNTVAPPTPTAVLPADGSYTSNAKPAMSGTAEATDTVTVYIDGTPVGSTAADGSGNWSYTPTVALSDGQHAVKVTATNAANNVSAYSNTNTFTVDTVAPAAPVVNAPADGSSTNEVQPPVTGTAEANSTVTVYLDGTSAGTATADGSGAWSFTPPSALSDGQHTVHATASDRAGNTSGSSSTNTFTVDTQAPAAPVVSVPADGTSTSSATPTISGTAEPDSTVTVWIDGSSVGTVPADGTGAWTFTPSSPLGDGAHAAKATATDAAGNISAYSSTSNFTVVTAAPAPPVITAPVNGSVTSDSRPAIAGTATADDVVTVSIDGQGVGSTTADSSGNWTLVTPIALAAGPHTATATAADGAGNVSAPSAPTRFTVDSGAPRPPAIVSAPPAISRTSSFTFAADPGDTLQCSVDGQAWQQCPTSYDPSPLADGPHTLAVRQVDGAGTPSSAQTVAWVLDTTAPGPPTVTSGPLGATPVDHGSFAWTPATPGGTFQCALDGGPWTTCVQGVTYTGLALGPHVFAVREIDPAGNVGAVSTQRFDVGSKDPHAPTRAAVDASRRVLISADLPVGCHLDHGALQACTVVAWGRVHDRWRYFGAGSVTLSGPQGTRAPVTIHLDPLARSMLQRTYAGVPTVLSARATAFGLGHTLPASGFTRIVLPSRLLVPDTGLFAFDSAVVQPAGERYVDYLGTSLSGVRSLTCVGFTDSIGSEAYNYALGLRRAAAVCARLAAEPSLGGVPYHVQSYGKLRPRASNATSAGRALNRFVQVLVAYRSVPYVP